MGLINYDVKVSPAKPGANLSISATPSSLTVHVDKIDDISLSVKPTAGTIVAGALSGAILGSLVGGPAYAVLMGAGGVVVVLEIAKLLEEKGADALRDNLNGIKEEKVTFDPLGYSIDVTGVTVTVSLKTLQLATYTDTPTHTPMLMATGALDVK